MRYLGGVKICCLAVVFSLFASACSQHVLRSPEASARAIMQGLIERDFSVLASRFSGEPLRALMASGGAGGGQGFENFCRRLLPITPPPALWTLKFTRAIQHHDGSTVELHLCLVYEVNGVRRLFETKWRMQLIDGGWKLVAI